MVAYGLLALHPDKVGNVIIAAASPGGPDALLPPVPVTQEITAIQRNYTALLPYLFPQGTKDEGEVLRSSLVQLSSLASCCVQWRG